MNNKKYFITSDIHSFFSEFKSSLKQAGFRKTNKEHILIICGDLFDRGNESVELYNYLKTLPKKRLILIKGNHESLLLDCLKKDYPGKHDFSNGTVKTLCHFANIEEKMLDKYYWYSYFMDSYSDWDTLQEQMTNKLYGIWNTVKNNVLKSEFYKWLTSNVWKDFYELDNFIFTHAFIPIKCNDLSAIYYNDTTKMSYMSDWRTSATHLELEDSRWGCPYRLFNAGLFDEEIKKDKILVCGHWHASDFHEIFKTSGKEDNYDIYFGKNLIALDACTVLTYKVNILIYDGNNCFDQYNNKLNY